MSACGQLWDSTRHQEKVLELARPQLALVPLGYSVSLLLWDPRGPGTQLPFQSVIWQVIDTVFQELEALGDDTQSLQVVSLVQVSTHDKAWDLLRPDGRALQVMDVAPLGLMVEEATEVAVPNAQAAISAYARGLGAIPALFQGCDQQPLTDGPSAVQGAGSLFTLTVERGLEGGRCQHSALRILVSPGAIGPCPRLESREPAAVCLPWIVEQLLEGNSLTFLLLCVSLPDTSREEILGALGLAERVKGMAKTISATLWDPEEEIAARRREIRGLRMELLAGPSLPEQSTAVAQLQRALRELKVLKNQRWEKKQAVAKVLGTSEMHQPNAEVGRGQARPSHPGTVWTRSLQGIQCQLQPLLPWHCSPECSPREQGHPGAALTLSLSPQWDTERWQREAAALGLSLEAALREREAAEGELEALLHRHRQEMRACRQHLLQVLRDQQRLAEEQREALERRHRALLQEVLRDALELAEHNQHLRDSRRAGTANAATQSP
ncbi:hypothetical protein HGM15179_005072 [Zosterops borbonicus]|uniref:Uncharacterized protein n=1 Tax=Zosterops borbonicus TaxID=364589 RepID=A0A8K1GPY4_9PASS|nr:hypothetical protein HGM15179_005072 [Zosterops borbonicus]